MLRVLLACGLVLLVAGCEAAFDPFDDTDAAFSLFGYLDVSADTQFVRIDALRTSAYDPAPLDAVVTLERTDTGETVALHDSVFTFSNGAIAHNFWTATPVAPDAAYRLTVQRPDGARATAAFDTPRPFPAPVLDAGLHPPPGPPLPPDLQTLRLYDVEKLADLRIRYDLANPNVVVTISYVDRVRRTADGYDVVSFGAYADVREALGGGCPSLFSAEVFIAATTEDWPDLLDLDPERLALPGTVDNVDGGIGYVGGVMTRRLPWPDMALVFDYYASRCRT